MPETQTADMLDTFMRDQLLDRRHKLQHAVAESAHAPQLHALLSEVDNALARMDCGSFGICEYCHTPVETDRLIADPLTRFCLNHLNKEQRDALEHDLQLAAQVQRALLPQQDLMCCGWHVAHHYEPVGIVSGDYFDIVDAGENGFYFMVGDVSGKGVAASMLMAHLHAMFRTLISVGLPLEQILSHATRVFCESTLPNQYATLICGRAEPNGRVVIVNAGHPPPLHVHDGAVTPVEASGLPVGMFCNEQFLAGELNLRPGHSLLMYTDGISEASDSSGAQYGSDRLCKLIARSRCANPSQLIAACRDDLRLFCNGSLKSDDTTIVVLGRMAIA
ncbi:MAG: SpoIIE family protein phosphatase [Acidobacteriaceae bacterium]|nr:SpoIIE family protein phosphatase [Acidobacteriaceae bacterium]MBV9781949.1 SpoIIE family protein phosphatase [Acidobacteriaceae bacterium]